MANKTYISETGKRVKLKNGKRLSASDFFQQIGNKLPLAVLHNTNQIVNHKRQLKRSYRLYGEEGLKIYLRNCDRAVLKIKYPFWSKIMIALNIW